MRPPWTVLVGCVLALVAVSALSRQVAPAPATADDRVAGPALVPRDGDLPAVEAPPAGVTGSTSSPVTVPTAVGTAAGTVVLPQGRPPAAGWPGLVLVHGSGDGRGTSMLPWAEQLARRGIAVAVYDKRGPGYSAAVRDFGALADDAVAAADVLRGVAGVDPARVGMAGFSEGGWVVPLAAVRDPRLVGVVQLSGPNVMPNQQIAWQLDVGLADASAPRAARSALLNALSLRFPGNLMAFGRFDPRPSLAAADVPLLAVFGLADSTVPIEDGAATVLASRRSGTASTTVLVVPGLGHGLTAPAGGPSDDVVGLVAGWLAAPPAGPRVEVRGSAAQQRHATPVLRPPLAGFTPVLFISSTLVLLGLVLNRLGRRSAPPGPRHRPWDVAATAALIAAVGNHLGLAGLAVAAVLGGGPVAAALAWLVVKIGSAATVVATARALVLDPPGRPSRPGTGLRRAGGLIAALGGVGLAVVGGALTAPW